METIDFSTLGVFDLCGFDLWVRNSVESYQLSEFGMNCVYVCLAGIHTNILVDVVPVGLVQMCVC